MNYTMFHILFLSSLEGFFGSGKAHVVTGVAPIILAGIAFSLWRMDRRLARIESESNDTSDAMSRTNIVVLLLVAVLMGTLFSTTNSESVASARALQNRASTRAPSTPTTLSCTTPRSQCPVPASTCATRRAKSGK